MSKKSRRERVTAVNAIKGKRATYVKHTLTVRTGDTLEERPMTQAALATVYRTGKLPQVKVTQTSVKNLLPCAEAA